MGISFDTIPSGLRKPAMYFEFNSRLAVHSLPANVKKLMIIGQKLKDPTAWTANTAYTAGAIVKPTTMNGHLYFCITAGTSHSSTEPTWPTTQGGEVTDGTAAWKEFTDDHAFTAKLNVVQCASDTDAYTAHGEGSMLHCMVKAALKTNAYLQLYTIAEDNGAGVHASGTFAVTGTPNSSGYVRCWIGDEYVEVSFVSGDTATAIATAIKAAIAAKPYLPVVASSSTGTVTVIFKYSGTVGNQLKLAVDFTASSSLSVVATSLSGGTTDPDIHASGSILDKIAPVRYHRIVTPYNGSTALGYTKTHANTVSSALEQRPCVIMAASVDSLVNAQALSDALNHERTVIVQVKASKTPAYLFAAMAGAIECSYSDPAKPRNGAAFTVAAAPAVTDRTLRSEQETLLLNGITPLEVEDETVKVVRMITTYQTNETYLDITTIDTLDYTRDALLASLRPKFTGGKCTETSRNCIKSEVYAVLKQLEALEIVENVDDNIDGIVIEQDGSDKGRVNIKVPTDVVNGMHVIAGRIDLIL